MQIGSNTVEHSWEISLNVEDSYNTQIPRFHDKIIVYTGLFMTEPVSRHSWPSYREAGLFPEL